MKKILLSIIALLTFNSVFADETIFFIRHGEKPEDGLGQINCQGLNRALALPKIISQKIGKPDYIFASNPTKQKNDKGNIYDYIRPLATIEPTAVYFEMPINVQIGFEEKEKIINELLDKKYADKKIIIAWEHRLAEEIVRDMTNKYGNNQEIPKWESFDFDSFYILNIRRNNDKVSVEFRQDNQNLNNLPKTCTF